MLKVTTAIKNVTQKLVVVYQKSELESDQNVNKLQ